METKQDTRALIHTIGPFKQPVRVKILCRYSTLERRRERRRSTFISPAEGSNRGTDDCVKRQHGTHYDIKACILTHLLYFSIVGFVNEKGFS